MVLKDDGIRHDAEDAKTELMAMLKHLFKPDDASTSGNSSQVLGSAAAVVIKYQGQLGVVASNRGTTI